jgi:hypothetical protein
MSQYSLGVFQSLSQQANSVATPTNPNFVFVCTSATPLKFDFSFSVLSEPPLPLFLLPHDSNMESGYQADSQFTDANILQGL